jgi:hypothetical protein
MEGLERLHQRFLDEILRLRPVTREPHRMAKQAIDVRHRFRFEREPAPIRFGVSAHRPYSAIDSQTPQSRQGVPLFHPQGREFQGDSSPGSEMPRP